MGLLEKIKHRLFNLPLRTFIVVPVATLFVLAMLISANQSYQTSRIFIDKFLEAHSLVISKSISTQLDNFLSKAVQNTEINKELIEIGALDYKNADILSAHFVSQLKHTPYMTYVSMGFPNGEYLGASRQVLSGEISLFSAKQSEGSTFNRHRVLGNDTRGELVEKRSVFNATERDWYKTAEKLAQTHWYPVYKYAGQDALGIGVSAPVYDQGDHHLLGVLTADLALNRISEFLQDFQIDQEGIIFIAEPSGKLVATSSKQVVYVKEGVDFKRFTVLNYPDQRVREAWKLMASGSENTSNHVFKANGHQYHLNSKVYQDQFGQNLIIGVVLSVDTFTSGYMKELYNRIFMAMAFLLLIGIILVLILQQSVLPPIQRLVRAHASIKNRDYSVRVPNSKIREISVLTKGFNETAEALENYEEIEKAYMAHEKMATLGGLVSGITHEINTPLGMALTISSYIEKNHKEMVGLVTKGELSKSKYVEQAEDMNEDLAILHSNLKRAAELIKSFKAIAVGQSHETVVLFNVNELLSNLLVSLKHEYKQKHHQFAIECDPSMVINSYPGALTQIFTNLIMNSILHGFGESRNGSISISVTCEHGEIHIVYRDNGKGMSDEVLEKLFVPFFTTNRENGGTGIGMNIVNNIVKEQLKGKLSVQSQIGNGVQFDIIFEEVI